MVSFTPDPSASVNYEEEKCKKKKCGVKRKSDAPEDSGKESSQNSTESHSKSKRPQYRTPTLKTDYFINNFDVITKIGEGAFGKVFKVKQTKGKEKGQYFAIKKIEPKKPLGVDTSLREVRTLRKSRSQYVVHCHHSWFQKDKSLYIKMELCSYSLQSIIPPKTDDQILNLRKVFGRAVKEPMKSIEYFISCRLFKELLECVQYLHESKSPIIHRDLKPGNVLIVEKPSNGRYLKLCDFGLAKTTSKNTRTHTLAQGTPKYMAPETHHKGYQFRCKYTFRADIYSLGVIAVELFDLSMTTSKIPGYNSKLKLKMKKLKELISSMTFYTQDMRPTTSEVLDDFESWGIAAEEYTDNKDANDVEALSKHQFFSEYVEQKLKSVEQTNEKIGKNSLKNVEKSTPNNTKNREKVTIPEVTETPGLICSCKVCVCKFCGGSVDKKPEKSVRKNTKNTVTSPKSIQPLITEFMNKRSKTEI